MMPGQWSQIMLPTVWKHTGRSCKDSVHVTCLCHIINLVGETCQHCKYLSDATSLVTWMRSVFEDGWPSLSTRRLCRPRFLLRLCVLGGIVGLRLSSTMQSMFTCTDSSSFRGVNRHGSQEHPQPVGNRGEGADPHSQVNLHLRDLLQTDDSPDHPGRNPQTHSSVCIQCHGGSCVLTS